MIILLGVRNSSNVQFPVDRQMATKQRITIWIGDAWVGGGMVNCRTHAISDAMRRRVRTQRAAPPLPVDIQAADEATWNASD
jgi:hypothetical protein